ncbi:hypothetical protein PBI_HOWE_7 [Gordonia phage Howe]|uniref:Head-to-tail connector protein n=1 Tax=Gordonia phage Howe TaxID=1777061 RepID=A0A0U3TFC1_9CAUD|nr:head-tail connector protein [Gordonia phage Howe]AZF93197.1 hypothetical protein SEA_ADORA_7 [Gordonia phage Adora]QDF16790.1 hypothetical protein SEA_TWINKLE_7 [Gordonia phage Twinkle]QYC54408.1 hypothetical protein SEA_SHLIM410_7 [Gordonia phage Shlim410]UAJ16259.1 hypothetical protein SEA_HORTENSE_7 [Gordonia phage Hortense]ALY07641.1 hypothetical protein PBI_HOWE_7 [Gordonia phage Howe]
MGPDGVEYILTATSWRDVHGVRHRRGDVVTPPESEVERLLRAKAITTPEAIAAAEAAAEAAREAQEAAAAQAVADRADEQLTSEGDLNSAVPPEVTPPTAKPRKVAPVKEWEDYAVALHEASGGKEGFPRADAEAMSKADLIEALQ